MKLLNLLILGGTRFVGRHLTETALAAVVVGLLNDPSRHARMREAAKRAGRPDAAVELARDVLRIGRCA